MDKKEEMKSKEVVVKNEEHQITKFDSFHSVDEMMRFAGTLIDSGLVPHTLTEPEAVVAVIIQGRELGLQAMTALSNIHVIEGKPALGIHLISSLIRKAGIRYELVEDFVYVKADGSADEYKQEDTDYVDARTTFIFYEKWGDQVLKTPLSFTWSNAKEQGLTNKSNWKKLPKLYWAL